MNEAAVETLFRRIYLADLELGCVATEHEYRELFDGNDALISRLYTRMSESDSETTDGSTPAQIRALTSFAWADEAPQRIGHYRIERELGRGGQAIVYRAHDEELGRPIALKVLTGLGPGSASVVRRFQREATVASRLNHSGICTVYEAGVQDGLPFIAMELVTGQNLATRIQAARTGPLADEDISFDADSEVGPQAGDPDVAGDAAAPFSLPDRDEISRLVKTFELAARALHAAHEAGIIHRDVKPANIMIRDDGSPVILDFGLARGDDEQFGLTQTGDFFGTPSYMSPEQISAHRIRLDHRTDIFSLGATLYECLTTMRPFDAPSREAIYQAIMTKDPVDPRRLNPAIAGDLRVITETALHKDRDRRYPTAEAFAEDLRRFREHEPILARPTGPLTRARLWCQRNRAVAALMTTLALVLGIGVPIVAVEKRRTRAVEQEMRNAAALRVATRESFTELFGRQRLRIFSPLTDPTENAELVKDLRLLGDEGRDLILGYLESSDWQDRILAAQLLPGLTFDATSIDTLTRITLETEDETISSLVSHALMRTVSPDAVRAMRRLARDGQNTAVRVNALWGLCHNLDPHGIEQAHAFFLDESQPKMMRIALANGFLAIPDEKMVPLVNDWLDDILARDSDADRQTQLAQTVTLIRMAIYFYREVGSPSALAKLTALAADERLSAESRERAQTAVEELRAHGLE